MDFKAGEILCPNISKGQFDDLNVTIKDFPFLPLVIFDTWSFSEIYSLISFISLPCDTLMIPLAGTILSFTSLISNLPNLKFSSLLNISTTNFDAYTVFDVIDIA